MALIDRVTVVRVDDEATRLEAVAVLRAVYREEKGWVPGDGELLSRRDLDDDGVCWFLTRLDNEPVGVVRVLFDVPTDLYCNYGFKLLSDDFDIAAFVANSRIAEERQLKGVVVYNPKTDKYFVPKSALAPLVWGMSPPPKLDKPELPSLLQ